VKFLEESNTSEERLKRLEQNIEALKKTEEIYRNSAQKYSSLFNNTSDGIWINNLSGVVIEVNEAYIRMSGYSKEEIIGTPISKFECTENPQEIAQHIKKVLETGGHDRFETQHCRKDGSTYDVDITALYLPEQEGGQMAIFIRDITGRKSAERALRYSEERFRLVAEATKLLVYEIDLNHDFIVIFRGEDILGYKAGEIPRNEQWWLNQIHPKDRAYTERKFREAIETRTDYALEYKIKRKQGDYIFAYDCGRAVSNEEGRVTLFVGGMRDITQSKKVEETLRENEDRLELAQRVARLGSWEFYVKEDRAVWSKEMFNLFGIKPQKEAPNITEYSRLIHPDDLKDVATTMERLLDVGELGETISFDYRIVRPDGSVCYLHSERMVREVDENGKAKRVVGIEQDVTERMKAESAIKESEQRYHSLFSSLTEGFAYCQMLFNQQEEPVDFVYLEINDAFERQTGLRRENIVGRKVSEAIPGTREANPELIEKYGRVAKTGNPERFEIFFKPISTWFDISVYSPNKAFLLQCLKTSHRVKKLRLSLKDTLRG
jgi:PAS domain S-box-containing protein